jgi:hypothetical protein
MFSTHPGERRLAHACSRLQNSPADKMKFLTLALLITAITTPRADLSRPDGSHDRHALRDRSGDFSRSRNSKPIVSCRCRIGGRTSGIFENSLVQRHAIGSGSDPFQAQPIGRFDSQIGVRFNGACPPSAAAATSVGCDS